MFLVKCQANFLRAKKESLKADEVIVLGDFAENYQFLVQEIQSYHWSKEYCTLDPLVYILLTVMEIFNTILFVSSLMITTTIQILFIKYKQSLLITLKKTFQLRIRSSISVTAVLNNTRIAKTLLICVIIRKISVWMVNGYSLQLVMASHHVIVLEDLLNVMLQNVFYKDPSMTKFLATNQIDIKNIKCFSYVSCIYDTFWWVGIVTKVNVHESDLKIEFLHPHGPTKTFSWPSVADKYLVPASNILCVITSPATITGQMCRISDTDFEQTVKAYENHKM